MTDRPPFDDDTLLRLRHGGRETDAVLAAAKTDPDVAARLAEWDREDAALQALYGPLTDEPVPERLRSALTSAAASARADRRSLVWRIAAAVVLVAAGMAGGWWASGLTGGNDSHRFADDALRAHGVFASDVARPVEVAADDTEKLSRWLSKRVGQSIALPNLTDEGLDLLGGRLVPGDAGPAALLMYEDASGNRLSLVVGSEPDIGERPWRISESHGLRAVTWADGGLICSVVADLPADDLRRIAKLAYGQLI